MHAGRAIMTAMLQWDDLRYFLAVHRHGAHAAAGRALRVAPTTICRRLAALEEALGVKLFQRTPLAVWSSARAVRCCAPMPSRSWRAGVFASERELTGRTGACRAPCASPRAMESATHLLAPRLTELPAGAAGGAVGIARGRPRRGPVPP